MESGYLELWVKQDKTRDNPGKSGGLASMNVKQQARKFTVEFYFFCR